MQGGDGCKPAGMDLEKRSEAKTVFVQASFDHVKRLSVSQSQN